jgi:hypothetical protein
MKYYGRTCSMENGTRVPLPRTKQEKIDGNELYTYHGGSVAADSLHKCVCH